MSEKFKNIATTIVYIIIGIAVVGWLISSCISSCQRREGREKEEIEKKQSMEKDIKGMIAKWNAVIDWDKQLKKDLEFDVIFTAELQDILIREDKRPILAFLTIKDVVKRDNDSYIAYFEKSFVFEPSIRFVVHCNSEQYSKILSGPIHKLFSFEDFALVIAVRDVYSSPYFYSNGYKEEDFINTKLIPAVIGECLDIIYLGFFNRKNLDLGGLSEETRNE